MICESNQGLRPQPDTANESNPQNRISSRRGQKRFPAKNHYRQETLIVSGPGAIIRKVRGKLLLKQGVIFC
jgi:hypothetical protein